MKKVLILAYDFPPYNSIGAQRPASWLKYFHEFGYYPIVITRHWNEDVKNPVDYIKPSSIQKITDNADARGRVIRVPYRPNIRDKHILKHGLDEFQLIRKALSLFYMVAPFYTFAFDSTAEIYRQAEKIIAEEDIKVVIPCAEPFILFRYAHLLSVKYGIRWIADYRDLWSTDNSDFTNPLLNKLILRKLFYKLERKTLNNASFITTASPSYQRNLQKMFPYKRCYTLFNGYDNETFDKLERRQQNSDVFTIAYAGTIYENQNLELFLDGFKKFLHIESDAKINLTFYGLDFYPKQKQRLLSYNPELNKYINTTPRLSYYETILKMQEANILLLLSRKYWDKLAGKIFDYLALERKIILAENDRGILENLMDECDGGVKCNTPADVSSYLVSFYQEFLRNGMVEHRSTGFKKYSRKLQTKELCNLISKSS